MCPLVASHAPSFGRQLWGLLSRMEYLSPQGVLLLRVYGTTASTLWLELRGHSAWQATPSWIVYQLACHQLPPPPRVAFVMVPDAASPGGSAGPPQCARPMGCGLLFFLPRLPYVRGVPGHFGPVHQCGRSVRCVTFALSWATWLVFGSVLTWWVGLRVPCPGPLGSCSPVCSSAALCCVCDVVGHLSAMHKYARPLGCVACAASWDTWLPFSGAYARCVALCIRCPGPLGPCSPVFPPAVLSCVCRVLGHLAPIHQCARSVRCLACAVSWVTWVLFTGVYARRSVLRVHCPWPLGSCSLVYTLGALRCVCGGCPGPLGSCSPVCPLDAFCCLCRVLGHMAPVHWCVRSVRCVACAVSWATWLLFTGVLAWRVVLRVRCPGPLGLYSLVCMLGVLCWLCGVLGHLAPVHWCARSLCCFACAVS